MDNFFLGIFQSTADTLQSWTGKSCFWYARLSLYITTVFGLISGLKSWNFVLDVVAALFHLLVFSFTTWLAERSTRNGMMNREATNWAFRYFLWATLLLAVLSARVAPWNFFERLFFVFWSYFAACTPGPKNKSKIRKAVEKLSELLRPLPTPVPVPTS